MPGPGGGDLIGTAVAAASGVDAEVVLVRGEGTPDLPPNVRAVGWAPLAEALATCAGVVHHGGAGTLLAALAAGVPQIVVPGPGDRRRNAELVEARGAGLAVPVRQIDAGALRRLVTDDKLAAAAGEVRDEMAALPHPSELVGEVAA